MMRPGNLPGYCLASETWPAVSADRAIPVGGACGGLQGAKLEKEYE